MINIQDLLEEARVQSWEAERQGCWAQAAVGMRGPSPSRLVCMQAQRLAAQPAPGLPGERATEALKG